MVLHVHWQVVALLCKSGKLLVQWYAPVVMETRVPVVNARHHWVSLEVKSFVRLSRLLFIAFIECTLAFGGCFVLKAIVKDLFHVVWLLCEFLQLAHPSLVVASLLANPSKLENALLFPVVEVQVLSWVIETVRAVCVAVQ